MFSKISFESIVDRHLFRFWPLNILGWTLYAFNHIYAFYFTNRFTPYYIAAGMAHVAGGFLLTVLLRYIYTKMELHKRSWGNVFLRVVFISLLFAIILYISDSITSWAIHSRDIIFKEKTFLLKAYYVFFGMMIFWGWSAFYLSFKYWSELNKQKIKISEVERLATNAQLASLRYQLNPHFLFNSLSSLRALINSDKEKAKMMITKISEFLRYSLMDTDVRLVPFDKELSTIKNYLDIEKIRFEDYLSISFNIDPLAEEYPVPPFILNPIIDNAIKHGSKTSQEKLNIDIGAQVDSFNRLIMTVTNSGKWENNENDCDNNGTGLKNIMSRLKMQFPDSHEFEIIKKSDSTQIRIVIKYEQLKN